LEWIFNFSNLCSNIPRNLKRYCRRIGVPEEAMNRIFTSPFNVGILQRYVEDWQAVVASLGLCNRVPVLMHYNLENLAQLYTLTTGIDLSPEDLKLPEKESGIFIDY